MLSKRVLCTRSAYPTQKVSPPGDYLCLHKTGGNFSRGKFPPKFPGKMSRQIFPEKFFLQKFPTKVLRYKLCKSLIYRLQSIIQV